MHKPDAARGAIVAACYAMKLRVFFWSLISALAGFLFGFDTVVISGAEKTIQEVWNLSPWLHGLIMGSALYGTVMGSFIGAWPTDRLGRKPTLFCIGMLYLVSAVWSALAGGPWSFAGARWIGGVGVGIATVAAPLYIAEISPAHSRGRLAALFQFNIVFGILAAFLSNWLLKNVGDHAWRWMMGAEALPALVYTLACLVIPESPRWLLAHRHWKQAEEVLRSVSPGAAPADLPAPPDLRSARGGWACLGSAALRRPVLIAFLIAVFNQLSGINAVLYFAPRIFELTGLGPKAALLQSVGIGVTNLIFTFAGLALIDRLGRRTLLYLGSLGYIVSLGLCAWAFFSEHFSIVPACIFAFIAAHAVGQGAVIWVLISEIFPDRARAAGQALGSATHWVFAALLTTLFPKMVTAFAPGYVFLFFCGMMVLQLLWVKLMVPETKGRSFEDIQREFTA